MLRRAFLFATFLSLGCTSSDFQVAETDANSTGDTGSSTESGADVAPGPCDPEPDKAKYCIEVKLARPDHPPYTTESGAVGLGIDGTGRVILALWDKDLASLPPGSPTPEPKVITPYPSATGEINIDKDFPITISGSDVPGKYTMAAAFLDNLLATRGSGDTLAGDFVVLPTVNEGKLNFPQLTLSLGTVQKATLELRPARRVSVTLGFSTDFVTYAKTQPTIHGDGPTMFGLFDGELGASTAFLNLDFGPCIATNIQTVPTAKVINFTTTVEGDHNAFAALFDYASTPSFPGKGTLISTQTAPYPRVSIKSDSWTASATIDLTSAYLGAYPASSAPEDMLTCK